MGILLQLAAAAWLSTALHEAAHAVALRAVGGRLLAVGTGAAPFVLRAWIGGVRVYVGAGEALSGLTVSAARPARWRAAVVAAAGPLANLAIAVAAALAPLDADPLLREGVVGWNLLTALVNGVPAGGNDGAGVLAALAGRARRVAAREHAARMTLYESLGLGVAADEHRWALGLHLAGASLPGAARTHLHALVRPDGPWRARRAVLAAALALAEGRFAEARAGFEAVLADPDVDAPTAAHARFGLAEALGRDGALAEGLRRAEGVPEPERATLAAVTTLAAALHDRDVEAAERAAHALGPALAWEGAAMLADLHLARGDLPRARARATAAADATARLLAELPGRHQAEALAAFAPLDATLHRLADALGAPGLARALSPRTRSDDAGQLLYQLAGTVCGASVLVGLAVAVKTGMAVAVLWPNGAPVVGLVGAQLLERHHPLAFGRPSPGGRAASLGVLAVVLGTWGLWFAGF